MTPLGLVDTGARLPEPAAPSAIQLRLHVEDALASARRLWVRGRLNGLDQPARTAEPHWWSRWWSWGDPRGPTPTATLETQVSGTVLQADVPILPDGRFEAQFAVQFPPARRGWRLARNRLTLGQQTLEGCGIVLAPPPEATTALVVVLALANSYEPRGPQELAHSEPAFRLVPVLQRLQQQAHGRLPIYYVAGITGREEDRQAQLALAATALGWPAGSFLLVPGAPSGLAAELAETVDRLRWLFAGGLDLQVVNLEPTAAPLLTGRCRAQPDRAVVRRLVNPDENAWTLLDESAGAACPGLLRAPRPTRATHVTRYPLVFCHGMLAFSTLRMQLPPDLNYFSPLREFLQQRGFRVLFPQVSPTAGVAARAGELYEHIVRWTDEPVNLIAHSMGGLDARHLLTHLGLADRVRSLTTICTPHRGTYLADWFTANFRQRIPLLVALEALGMNVDGFHDCRLAVCAEFNAATPDMPGVRYFSYGGVVQPARLSPMLRRAWNILTPVEGANDGFVSLASARWGEYLGTIHADHFAQTPDAVFLRPGEDFDSLGFFSRLVEDLARRGF